MTYIYLNEARHTWHDTQQDTRTSLPPAIVMQPPGDVTCIIAGGTEMLVGASLLRLRHHRVVTASTAYARGPLCVVALFAQLQVAGQAHGSVGNTGIA